MVSRRIVHAVDGDRWRKHAECQPGNGYPFGLWDTEEAPRTFATRREQRAARIARQAMEKAAKAVCEMCPVRRECLEFSLINDEREGIWGGLNPTERGKTPLR
jgi:hypothetical protein